MPEIRYYTVTQEREVKVWANNPTDAVRIADAAFKKEAIPTDVPGNVIHKDLPDAIHDLGVVVREDY